MVLKLKRDFLLEAGGRVERSLPMVSGSLVSVNLFVLVCAGEELFIAFNHSALISSHSPWPPHECCFVQTKGCQ